MATEAEDLNRRDFLVIAGNAFVAVGAAVTLWPFIDQMNPDAGAQALASGAATATSRLRRALKTPVWHLPKASSKGAASADPWHPVAPFTQRPEANSR